MAVTNFIWDEVSDNVLFETDENGAVTASYTNRPEQFGKLISQERSGVTSYYHYDGEHSTRQLTDENQNVTDTFIYSAFGEEVARTGVTTNPFGYKGAVGYYTNSATNDIYVRARTYQPTIGRWLSKDPLGFVDGPNVYRAYFVPNGADPRGLDFSPLKPTLTFPPSVNPPICQSCDDFVSTFILPVIIKPFLPTHGKACNVLINCMDQCPDGSPAHTTPPDANGNVQICLSRKLRWTRDLTIILIHEIKHARDFCHGKDARGDNCTRCLDIERLAHEFSCEFVFPGKKHEKDRCRICGTWRSCVSICKNDPPERCTGWTDIGMQPYPPFPFPWEPPNTK